MIEFNKIYNEDCLVTMKKIPDNFIDLIVTSPPYNKGFWSKNRNLNNGFKTKSRRIDYGEFNDCLTPENYENNQIEVIKECIRILKPSGSLFYNHIDILNNHQTIHPKWVYNFPLKQIIIWNRKNTPKLDKSYFFPINEYVFWIQKDVKSRVNFNRHKSLFNKSIWDINPDKNNKFAAPFPIEIPKNCILSCTKENDIIYDPYSGSGTTLLAAKQLNRQFIGSEISNEYYNKINDKL
jgi:modification methylase